MSRLRDAARRAALHVSAPALVHLDRRFADLASELREYSGQVARAQQVDDIANAVRTIEHLVEIGDAARAEVVGQQMARLAALRADLERVAGAIGTDGVPSSRGAAVTPPQAGRVGWADGQKLPLSPRVQAALDAKASSTNDFFGGWEESDLQLLQRWACDPSDLVPIDGVLVDWLGSKTKLENHPRLSVPDGAAIVIAELPVPDDRVHAETIEYVALLTSIERAQTHGSSYTMFELGSSYAPWSVSAGVLAHRRGFPTIDLCAVEASGATIPRIHEHIELNGLARCPGLSFRVENAAVSSAPGTLYFPRVDTRLDNGAQAVGQPSAADYRGLDVVYDEVEAVTFETLSADCQRIDFMHLDLQGAEEALLVDERFVIGISERVSAMLLATQSRYIEGVALRVLSAHGWHLHRERPTTFAQNLLTSDVNGWTVRDGAQFWLNSRFDPHRVVDTPEPDASNSNDV